MKIRRVLKSTAFRFSVFSSIVLTGSLLILGPLSFFYVQHSMIQEVRTSIEREAALMKNTYLDGGADSLFGKIREKRDINRRNRLLYFVEGGTGDETFDSIAQLPTPYGWHEVVLPENGLKVLLFSFPLSETLSLGVGANLYGLDRVQRILTKTLLLAVLVTLLLGSFAGVLISRSFLARLDQVIRAAERIGNGNLNERLETNGSGDDFDQLIVTINRMLSRIEMLLKSVRRVSAHVAHELRTPLGHLQQDLGRLEELGTSHEEGKALISKARAELDRALEIFAALLKISELESGELKAAFTQVSVSHIIRELHEIYAPVAEENGQCLTLTACEPHLNSTGDKRLLLQMFSNLIENAIRHSGSSAHIEIIVATIQTFIKVTIKDNGIGMSNDLVHAAQHKLHEIEHSETSDFSRGIGLHLVGAIARLHDIEAAISNNEPGVEVTLKLQRS